MYKYVYVCISHKSLCVCVYIYIQQKISHKTGESLAFCNNMVDLKGIMLSGISQIRKANTVRSQLYMESEKIFN